MSSPWKACDIRGVFPSEVSTVLTRGVGAALGSMLPPGSRVLVAGDYRISTPKLKASLTSALVRTGAHVIDAGQLPTPVAYFAHKMLGADAVVIVTASHNPPEYNGMKIMVGKLPPTPSDLSDLRKSVEKGRFRQAKGSYETVTPVPAYRSWTLERWAELRRLPPLPVVLDPGGGAWSDLAPAVFEALGFRVTALFNQIDRTFRCRSPNCARFANLGALRSTVKRTGAAIGIAWDGDGDRVAFVDETGSSVSTDEISALLVRFLLTGHSDAKVVYDIKLSEIVPMAIREFKGVPIVERSGHTFVKRRMIQEDCLFGCEVSGHYFFRELGGGDDGLFAALMMADLQGHRGPLGRLRQTLGSFFVTPELRLPVGILSYPEFARRLRALFPDAVASNVDGLRLMAPHGFVLIRESVTEPVLTLRIEGKSREAMEMLVRTCVKGLPEVRQEMLNQMQPTED